MTTNDSIERFARPSTALCMGFVVVSVFGWNLIMSPDTRVVMTLIGAPYLAISTVGWIWAERRGVAAIACWIAVLLALTAASLWFSYFGTFLLAMPIIAFPAIYGSLRWSLAMVLFFLAFAVACNVHWGVPPIEVYSHSTGFLPGAVFTVVASLLIAREREGRKQIRRYAEQVEELATTRERNRIARDIHDSVGHYLTVVNVQIEAARAIVAKDPAASNECLVRAQDLAKEGLSELRRSVTMLRAGAAEQRPFKLALSELVTDARGRGLSTELVVQGEPRALTPAVEFTLFRAAQEAFTNVTRHAAATTVTCTLHYEPRDVAMTITDDGVGAAGTTDGGFGLVGLRERAQLLGGSVKITTAAGRGFTVEVRVPT